MAHLAVFSILVVALAASGAYAGLIPSLPTTLVPIPIPIPDIPKLPDIIPSPESRADAVNKVRQGCEIGKKGVNIRISAFVAATSRDASLTPVCKKCIAEKSKQIRENTLRGIEATGDSIVESIDEASDAWLSVWSAIIGDLPELIGGVVVGCKQQLDTAKSDCIAQTAEPSA